MLERFLLAPAKRGSKRKQVSEREIKQDMGDRGQEAPLGAWAQRKEAKRNMYLTSTDQVRVHRRGLGRTGAAASVANALCQKCLRPGHWTYECKNEAVYVQRASRSQQLRNPKLRQPFNQDKPPDAKEEAVARGDKKSKKQSKKVAKDKSKSKSKHAKKSSAKSRRQRRRSVSSSSSSSSSSSDSSDSDSSGSSSDYSSSSSGSDSDSSDSSRSGSSSGSSSSDDASPRRKHRSKRRRKD